MQNTFPDYLIPFAICGIFVLLWRAREQPYARIGDSWLVILVGFVSLAAGEILHLILNDLAEFGYISE